MTDFPPLPEGLSYAREAYTPTRLERLAPRGPAVSNPGFIPQHIFDAVAELARNSVRPLPRPVGRPLRKPEPKAA